jgi:hypothetical protein
LAARLENYLVGLMEKKKVDKMVRWWVESLDQAMVLMLVDNSEYRSVEPMVSMLVYWME